MNKEIGLLEKTLIDHLKGHLPFSLYTSSIANLIHINPLSTSCIINAFTYDSQIHNFEPLFTKKY